MWRLWLNHLVILRKRWVIYIFFALQYQQFDKFQQRISDIESNLPDINSKYNLMPELTALQKFVNSFIIPNYVEVECNLGDLYSPP